MHDNIFLTTAFHWNFDHIVFGLREKAYILFCAVLGTFIVQVLFFDNATGGGGGGGAAAADGVDGLADTTTSDVMMSEIMDSLALVFVEAMVANVLMLPARVLLPMMMTSMNSISTCTEVPKSRVRRQADRLRNWLMCGAHLHRQRKVRRLIDDVVGWVAGWLGRWLDGWMVGGHLSRRAQSTQPTLSALCTRSRARTTEPTFASGPVLAEDNHQQRTGRRCG